MTELIPSLSPLTAMIGQMIGCGRPLKGPFIFNRSGDNRPPIPQPQQIIRPLIPQVNQNQQQNQSDSDDDNIEIPESEGQPHAVPKKSNPRLSKYSKQILMQWFLAHKTNPYANRDEGRILMTRTGLTERQIKVWLTNARIRMRSLLPNVPTPNGAGRKNHSTVTAIMKLLNTQQAAQQAQK